MDDNVKSVCESCLRGSYDNTLTFPQQLSLLADAGVEGYVVDLRAGTKTYYLTDGEALTLTAEQDATATSVVFNAPAVESAVRQSQAGTHTYRDFLQKVKAAGCSAYMVSLPGQRAVYFGRTAETHVEHFPS